MAKDFDRIVPNDDSTSKEVTTHPGVVAFAERAGQDDSSPNFGEDIDRPSLTSALNRQSPGDMMASNVSLLRASFGVYEDEDGDNDCDDQYYYPPSERTHAGPQIMILEVAVNDSQIPRDAGRSDDDDDDGDDLPKETGQNVPSVTNSYLQQASPMNDSYTYREHVFVVALGAALAFNSGFSNGVTLSGLLTPDDVKWNAQSTSGYTGIYTASALAVADTAREPLGQTRIQFVGFQICMILSFILGSCISALLNPRPSPWRLAPMYAPTFFIGGIFMCIAAALSSVDDEKTGPRFYYFVALANGVQNGISSMYSANLIRTTHMTGTSTDIGLFIGQWLRGNRQNLWKLYILMALAASFWFGGLCSFYAVQAWTHYTLLFNASIFLLLFLAIVLFLAVHLHLPVHRAIRGTWHWHRTMHRLSYRSKKGGVPKSEAALRTAFADMDADMDGYIDANELYLGLQKAGSDANQLPKATVDVMFEVADRDRDGRLSFGEFLGLVEGDHVIVG